MALHLLSCGYKKKNTWQRVRAVRQVQSFHSKHICVCWASVALGRQAATVHLPSLRLPSTERADSGSCRSADCSWIIQGEYLREGTCRHPSQPLSMLTVCVKSKCTSSLEFGFRKQPGDSATDELWCRFVFLFFLSFFFSGVYCLEGSFSRWSAQALILTLAEISLLACRAVLLQHQCRCDSRQTFPGWIHGHLLAEL